MMKIIEGSSRWSSIITILSFFICLSEICRQSVMASSKNKKHGHTGVLAPYDGKPIPIRLTPIQLKKLDNGEAVVYNERDGRSGRGVVVQDINASATICMQKIRDLQNYPKVVPHLKKVEIYETKKFSNGTTKTGAKFDVGVLGLKVGYFLMCTYEPKYSTFTWTLDYKYNSDFDDNVGHWQVIPHPTKRGWTRVLYSTKLKLFPWIPEFVISFLTGKALIESTGWVKRESELAAARGDGSPDSATWPWLGFKGGERILEGMEQAKRAVQEAEQSFHQRRQKFVSSWKAPTARFGFFRS